MTPRGEYGHDRVQEEISNLQAALCNTGCAQDAFCRQCAGQQTGRAGGKGHQLSKSQRMGTGIGLYEVDYLHYEDIKRQIQRAHPMAQLAAVSREVNLCARPLTSPDVRRPQADDKPMLACAGRRQMTNLC